MLSDKISAIIGHSFCQEALIIQALTHPSAGPIHNERLEFIGDSIVNLVIGEALYHLHPNQPEGELSRWRAALVQRETLAEIAKEWQLDQFLILGPGEKKTQGQLRASNLANAVEAIIGAIYLDAGFEKVKAVILKTYEKRLSHPEIANIKKDPKTELQEYLQAKQIPLPRYQLVKTTGQEHESIFYIQCLIPQLQFQATGSGTSKKRAEQDAAAKMIQQLKI